MKRYGGKDEGDICSTDVWLVLDNALQLNFRLRCGYLSQLTLCRTERNCEAKKRRRFESISSIPSMYDGNTECL